MAITFRWDEHPLPYSFPLIPPPLFFLLFNPPSTVHECDFSVERFPWSSFIVLNRSRPRTFSRLLAPCWTYTNREIFFFFFLSIETILRKYRSEREERGLESRGWEMDAGFIFVILKFVKGKFILVYWNFNYFR